MRQETTRRLAVLVDLDVDALVLGDLARESRHVDLQHLPMLPLVKDIAEHPEPDHGRPEQEGEHRIEAFHGISPLLRSVDRRAAYGPFEPMPLIQVPLDGGQARGSGSFRIMKSGSVQGRTPCSTKSSKRSMRG